MMVRWVPCSGLEFSTGGQFGVYDVRRPSIILGLWLSVKGYRATELLFSLGHGSGLVSRSSPT